MAVYTLVMRVEADSSISKEQIKEEIYDACADVPFGFEIESVEGQQ
jgi:hypothetical protein